MDETAVQDPTRVLIVDDEKNILRSLQRLLMDEPFETLTADSGEKALKILADCRNIGVIVSDQRMPGMTGVEFLEEARNISPDALRIVLTGYADMQAAMDAINRGGAYRYLRKPWDDTELVQTLREAVERHTLIQENRRLTRIVKKQNQELQGWNDQLQVMVQEQTIEIQKKNDTLQHLNERLKNNFKSTIVSLSGLLELRNRKVRNHSRNVAEIAVRIARTMKLSRKEIESITVAALLHDIGKIGIPDRILNKPPRHLTGAELNQYRLHPVRGQVALDLIEDLRDAGVLVRHHHERFNGSGFPDGLGAERIPLGARMIAIADFVDNTIAEIRGGRRIERTLLKAQKELGRGLDPRIYSFVEAPVRKIYGVSAPKSEMEECELTPEAVRPGMVLSRDLRSGTGLLLLRRGTVLNNRNIASLKRHHQLDPGREGVFVWRKRRA